jgi:Peptidase family M50
MPKLVRWVLAFGWVSFVVVPLVLVACVAFPATLITTIVISTQVLGQELGFALGVMTFVCCYPLALMHELGHLVAARWIGWSVRSVGVGPVTWDRVEDDWLWRWNWRTNWGRGRVTVSVSRHGRWRTALFAFAGPLANLLAVIAALVFVMPGLPPLVRCVGMAYANHSLFLLASSLYPSRGPPLDSDGFVLLKLLLDPTWRGPPNGTTR